MHVLFGGFVLVGGKLQRQAFSSYLRPATPTRHFDDFLDTPIAAPNNSESVPHATAHESTRGYVTVALTRSRHPLSQNFTRFN